MTSSASAPRRAAPYRADIDGLRAVAVLAVVWYHSGLPGLPGGFTGVDVFFVISGYLLAGIITRDLAAGAFSLGHFYQRRVRRIAPALIVVLLASLAAGYALLLPHELVKLGESALAALGMVPNFYFWGEGAGGYFAQAKRMTPQLLHTWSLGVEEQFYLLLPAVLLIAARFGRIKSALVLVTVLSFLLALAASERASDAAFYLLPTRAWELGLGCLLGVGALRLAPRLRTMAALAGIGLIAAGYLLPVGEIDRTALHLALPVLGTALLLGGAPDTPVGRVLALAPLRWTGRISYSLYLWHWPVFAFLRHWRIENVLPQDWALIGLAASVVLAWLSWRWIEQPARSPVLRFRSVLIPVLAGAVVIAIAAGAMIGTHGLPGRYSSGQLALIKRGLAQGKDEAPLARRCDSVPLDSIGSRCRTGAGVARVAIWGDSHAAADSAGIAAALGGPVKILSQGGCPPTLAGLDRAAHACEEHNRAVRDWLLARPEIKTVVLAALWPRPGRNHGPVVWGGVQQLVDALPGRRVVIIAGVPEPGVNVPWAIAVHAARNLPPPRWPCPPEPVPVQRAFVVDLSSAFCAHPQPWLLFFDSNHPSGTANREVIAPALRRALAEHGSLQ